MPHPLTRPHPGLVALAALVAAWATSGCVSVTTYQPLISLQKPVVVDPQVANFPGDRFLVRCIPGEAVSRGDAENLCRKVAASLRNQGAEVEEEVPSEQRPDASFAGFEGKKPNLIVDVRSRALHKENNPLLNYFSAITFTLVPAIFEESFASDVSIRDASGFLLASDTFQARFIEYYGVGAWALNWALDLAIRPDEDDLSGDAAKRDFSRDYYRQLSQLVLDARMRANVLSGFGGESAAAER